MAQEHSYSDSEFEKLLSDYDYSFTKGDLVKGIVCSYDSQGAVVDIGAKTSAYVPEREAVLDKNTPVEKTLEKGKEYEFLIIREEDEEGRFTLSYKKVAMAYSWRELEDAKASNQTVEGQVVSIVKGGVLVEVKGIRGFVPSSHLRVKSMDDIIGTTLELKILTMDVQQGNFILSNKRVYAEDKEDLKKDTLASVEVGKVVKGEVVRITDFGAFVDIGGVDALLPLSQISWKWVDNPSDVLKVGDIIDVEIIVIDKDKQRISVSLKNLEKDPWEEAYAQLKEGSKTEGKITRIKHFGAFVEVFDGVEALLQNDELVDYQNKHGVVLKEGDKINVQIVKFSPEDRRISLKLSEE